MQKRTAIVEIPNPRGGSVELRIATYRVKDGTISIVATIPGPDGSSIRTNVSDGATRPIDGWTAIGIQNTTHGIANRLREQGLEVATDGDPASTFVEISKAIAYVAGGSVEAPEGVAPKPIDPRIARDIPNRC